ncbi:MAG TPA: hypothetical protein VHZ25_17475 [Acidobacteriaceae bacterium]|jgi:hypothetical protein|nr:hypothetical protein [Acidobacteriaceae bacterium]
MQSDPGAEWQRLTRLYGEKSDEELLELAEDFGNLTETAQQVLRDELKRRRLEEPQRTNVHAESDHRPIFGGWNQAIAEQNREFDGRADQSPEGDDDQPVEFTWKTLLCECGEREEAWQVAEVLRRAGIESWIEGPRSQNSTDVRGPRVVVAADQLEKAKQVIARPIPQEVIDQSKQKVEDFVPPTCPKCGAADPVLESVEPSNLWFCENCGAEWSDSTGLAERTEKRDAE